MSFLLYTLCFIKNRTPETFCYNFKIMASISNKVGTSNLHVRLIVNVQNVILWH